MSDVSDWLGAALTLKQIRQAVFDGVMDYYGLDDSDSDDQVEASGIADAVMVRIDTEIEKLKVRAEL